MAVAAKSTADLPRLGILLMLLAWLAFSVVDLGAKWLAVAGLPAAQLAFMRYAGHFVISVGVIAKGGIDVDRFKTDHPWQLISRAMLLISATFLNFYALRFLPLTVVSAIMFSSPVIVCFLSVFVLKEKVGPWRWAAILLGFVGVLVVVRPFGTVFHPTMLLIIYNATALALYSIMTRKLSGIVAVDTMQFLFGSDRNIDSAALCRVVVGSTGNRLGNGRADRAGRSGLGRASTADQRAQVWHRQSTDAVHLFVPDLCRSVGLHLLWHSARWRPPLPAHC